MEKMVIVSKVEKRRLELDNAVIEKLPILCYACTACAAAAAGAAIAALAACNDAL